VLLTSVPTLSSKKIHGKSKKRKARSLGKGELEKKKSFTLLRVKNVLTRDLSEHPKRVGVEGLVERLKAKGGEERAGMRKQRIQSKAL